MEIHVIVTVVLVISVRQLCKVPFQFHHVLHHHVSRFVKQHTHQSALMVQEVVFINVRVVVKLIPIGLVSIIRNTNVTQLHVVALEDK